MIHKNYSYDFNNNILLAKKDLISINNQMLRKLMLRSIGTVFRNGYRPIFNVMLNQTLSYSFVNVPISSKYYHEPFSNSIEPCIKLAQKQEKLNQKVLILQHIAELVDREPKYKGKRLQNFMVEQLSNWKGSRGGRFERVATVAWIIKKLKLQKQLGDLYQEIVDRVEYDQWYVDFDEAVKAIQSFCDYSDIQRRNKVLEKVQRNIIISMGDVNMTYYQRICQSLYEADRYRSPLWNRLQHFVTRNLSMQYSVKTFFDIFRNFAITKNGTTQFYEICQHIIYKGHLYKNIHMLRNNLNQYNSSGDYFAIMIQTYALVNRHTPFPLSNDFLDYIYKGMMASKIQYRDIASLTKIVKYMHEIEFIDEEVNKVVKDVIENKQFTHYKSLGDIQELYFVMEGKFGSVAKKLRENVEGLVQKDIDRGVLPLPQAIQIVDFLLMYRNQEELPKLMIIDSLNKAIAKKYKYLQAVQKKQVDQLLGNQKLLKGKAQQIKGLLESKVTIKRDETNKTQTNRPAQNCQRISKDL